MMINRRDLIKASLGAGMALGMGTLFTACSGVTRGDLPALKKTSQDAMQLDDTTRSILYHASLAPSGHNSQPWRVHIDGPGTWRVEIDESRQLPAVDPNNRELLLSMGAFIENLVLAAGSLGFFADVNVVEHRANARTAIHIALHKDKPSGYPIRRIRSRRTVKHGQLNREIRQRDMEALAQPLGHRLFYFPRGSRHADCIRDAAVENYRIQARRDAAQVELVQWLRLSDADARTHRDGLTAEGMEIQGFKGWHLRHFTDPRAFLKESYRRQGVDMVADLAHEGAGWLIITSPGKTATDLIETGRRFERMALLAREHGIGIHPMTQILEEKNGLNQIAAHHGEDLFPQFVLRVGYLDVYPAPVSLRRPPEWFVHS